MSTVGDNILKKRRELGMTQEELAKRMGYKSKSTINKIEMGINDIPQGKIVKFAEIFGTTPAALMGWDDEEQKNTTEELQLTDGEKVLLDLFNRVPDEQKDLVLQMIRAALRSPEQ